RSLGDSFTEPNDEDVRAPRPVSRGRNLAVRATTEGADQRQPTFAPPELHEFGAVGDLHPGATLCAPRGPFGGIDGAPSGEVDPIGSASIEQPVEGAPVATGFRERPRVEVGEQRGNGFLGAPLV